MNGPALIEEILRTGVVRDATGNEYPLHSSVDRSEGEFVAGLITADHAVRRTLEIGCAYGLSSLYICAALAPRHDVKHVIVDPMQYSEWHGVGMSNVQRAGFDFVDLIVELSEFALPRIARREGGSFDLVFVDGWHTFDHTLLDLFYANRLVRVGGYIVVDDCNLPGVAKAVSYLLNYPAYEMKAQSPTPPRSAFLRVLKAAVPPGLAGYLMPRRIYDRYYVTRMFSSMVALVKVKEDERAWNWFVSF
jgi:predicted O-methyltransferase YrrM